MTSYAEISTLANRIQLEAYHVSLSNEADPVTMIRRAAIHEDVRSLAEAMGMRLVRVERSTNAEENRGGLSRADRADMERDRQLEDAVA